MSNTVVSWVITNLDREVASGLVTTVYYSVLASENIYQTSTYGTVDLDRADDIIPFEDLTEQLIIDWIKDKLGKKRVDSIIAYLQTQLNDQKTPKTAKGLPW